MELHFLSAPGEAAAVARATDWSATPLGPPEDWPTSLKTIVAALLASRHPMFLWWGPELVQIYNDAYVPSFGVGKHPRAMGQRGRECWEEIWPIIGPQIDAVMRDALPSWNEDQLVPIARNGRIEEVYWTYGYSPVFLENGAVGGTLVVCTETTRRVLGQRRLEFVRNLALELTRIDEPSALLPLVAEALARADKDVPFAIIRPRAGVAPLLVGIDETSANRVAAAVGQRMGKVSLDTPVRAGPWPEPIDAVFTVPIDDTGGSVVFGLSQRLPIDDALRQFQQQVVELLVTETARARVESERRNLLEQAPVATAIMTGPEHRFDLANPLYCSMVGRDVLGKTYLEAFPELRDTVLPGILRRVYESGEPFVTNEMPVPLDRGRGLEDCFFKFNLEPLRRADGTVYGMMAVAVDVTEQVVARQSLERTNAERARLVAELEAAGRAKDEFLAMLGHELRNPLAPILTALELLAVRHPDVGRRERTIIERQTRQLVHLVDDLLDVARVARGKIALSKERIALGEVVAHAVETTRPLIEQKGHVVRVDVPTDGLEVDGDRFRLSQVVANLLSNAARYTEAGGRIEIVGAREGTDVVLRVSDNGAGIEAKELNRIFEPFFQGPRGRDRAQGGLGLGLALVRTLVTLHGGTSRAFSEGLGRGSTFELRFPALDGDAKRGVEAALARPTAIRGMRVLLVDDNADVCEMFASFLQTFDLEVRTARDGAGAIEAIEAFHPEVAVLDIGLPGMDGYALANAIQARFADRAPRLIAMTGYGLAPDRESSRVAGFERHLTKPVDAHTLVRAVVGEESGVAFERARSSA